ncbi:serine/threonine-protein kinase [Delftia tsuruhatensis]|uniref:serine/threonine-protein kinase n=1 Tax=Delftia tsuruhatensis TaxID=180282 RepID=UPI0039BCFED0
MLKPFKTAKIDFDIIREIGQNGKNSTTHLINDRQLNAQIVAKTVLKSSLTSTKDFFAESQALYASAHPHVAQIHYACYDDDNVYIAMPYYSNGSLKERITGKNITVRETLTLATQILSALQNIHSKKLIHFDIKPDNILLSHRDEALLSDFGLAKHQNSYATATPRQIYGRMFPPEALTGKKDFDITFDIYQFGLTLYRMCNGNDHFYSQFNKYSSDIALYQRDISNGKFPDRNSYHPHIPTTLRKVINKCLEVNPSERYKSATEIVNAIAGIDGKLLDWVLTTNSNCQTWTKLVNGVEYKLVVDATNNATGTRTPHGGTSRKESALCGNNVSKKDIYSMLGDK